jgi:hypothetical protein
MARGWWSLDKVVVAGWLAGGFIAFLCYVLPLGPVLFVLSLYVVYGIISMFRTGAPVLLEISLVQLLGLCVAWPLALHAGVLKKPS